LKRLTGTHVYSYLECPRRVALDLHQDRSERRQAHPWEEFAAARGRQFEREFIAGLSVDEPRYPERDFAAGAAATIALLRAGAPLVYQAVLQHGDRLGLPDLLRKVPGSSSLGEHHYEVIDIKSSGRARGDQIMQVVFYSRLLDEVQGRLPAHGALILKDGREERFAIADFEAAAIEVETALRALAADPAAARPFFHAGCQRCHWDQQCVPAMQAAGDLSLVHGMSQGARAILESVGCRTVADLADFAAEGARARGNLDATLLRRLRRAARARLAGRPQLQVRPKGKALHPAALVHLLTDPYHDRVLLFGLLQPAAADGAFGWVAPPDRDGEWGAFRALLAEVTDDVQLLHFGGDLPRWYEATAHAREAATGCATRFVDLARRLRSAALFPAPVFTLADFVQHGLGRDGLRHGHPGAGAMWLAAADGEQRLVQKMHGDLLDLAALTERILEAETPSAEPEAELAEDHG
jgi:predicted RecB family nuclease